MPTQLQVGAFIALVGTALFLRVLFKGRSKDTAAKKNLKPDGPPVWDSQKPAESLVALLAWVEAEAKDAVDWYWLEKGPKARASRVIQATSLILTGAAGLAPVVIQILRTVRHDQWWMTDLWPSLFVGTAAALIGLDRAFGFSSGWARYVLAATDINTRLAEFRMDWIALTAQTPPPADQVAALIQKAKDFRVAVSNVVAQETRDWATEFQNNLAQREKDLNAQVEQLRQTVEKRQAASLPGAIDVTIQNTANASDVRARLEDGAGLLVAEEKLGANLTWTKVGIAPATYKLTVAGTVAAAGGQPARDLASSQAVTVVASTTQKVAVVLK